MAIVLKVTPEVLISVSDQIEGYLNTIRIQFQGIERDIQDSKLYWKGSASELHIQKYKSMKVQIEKVIDSLKRHPVNIQREAGVYREIESSATSAGQSLPTNVISS